MFEVEPIQLMYTWAPGLYNSDPRRASLAHFSVNQCARYVGRNPLAISDAMDRVDYWAVTSLSIAYHPWTNQVTNVPRHRENEVGRTSVHRDDSRPGRCPTLRAEEKIIHVMKFMP